MLDPTRLTDPEYRVRLQARGFLLPLALSVDEFCKDAEKYTLFEHEREVLGYMLVDDCQELSTEMDVVWLQRSSQEQYLAKPHADIRGIGVSPEAGRRGVATKLLHATEDRARARDISHLFSFVVISPVTNVPSVLFHEKNGFDRWTVLEPCSLFGIDDYQSILYAKSLSS